MKKVFQKNQIAITALAIMIAVAGYLNFTEQNASKEGNQKSGSSVETIDTMDISDGDSLIKEKAEKIGARLVLSSSYKNVLENKNYVLTNFYMYISASKNGSQYLDSLGGAAGVSASGSYTCNTFLLEAEERREESL